MIPRGSEISEWFLVTCSDVVLEVGRCMWARVTLFPWAARVRVLRSSGGRAEACV